MAKGRKKSKKTYSRRRVGAMSLNPRSLLVRAGSLAVGYLLAAKPINDQLDKLIGAKLDTKITGAGQIGLGALLMLKGKPSLVKTVLGGIIAGAGIKREAAAFGIGNVGGYGQIPVIGRRRLGGYGDIPVIGSGNGVFMGGKYPQNSMGRYTANSMVGRYAPNSMAGKYPGNAVMGSASNGNGSGSGLMQRTH